MARKRAFTALSFLPVGMALAMFGCAGADATPCNVTDNADGAATINCPGSNPVNIS